MQIATRQIIAILKTNHTKFSKFIEIAGISPSDTKGKEIYYDLGEVVQAWIKAATNRGEQRVNKAMEETRLKGIQADLKQLELDKKKGLLMERETVEAEVTDILLTVRNKLISLPDTLTNLTYGVTDKKKVRELIANKINLSLEELSKLEDVDNLK